MKEKNSKTGGGCLMTSLKIMGFFLLFSLILVFGWIAGIIWLIFFRKKMDSEPKKQMKYTIAISTASIISFAIFIVYVVFAPPTPTKLELVSEYKESELDVDTDYVINVNFEPKDASLRLVTYEIDNPLLATITSSEDNPAQLTLHTKQAGTVNIVAKYSDVESNTLTFHIIAPEPAPEPVVKEEENTVQEDDTTYPDSINGIDVSFSESVNNDVTGSWRLARVATTTSTEEYALDYYKAFFKDDDEVHVIVNFTLNTTAILNVFGDTISLDIHEYVDKEEHDASALGGGLLLASYGINKETGTIEELVDDDTEQEIEANSQPVDTNEQSSDVQETAETSSQATESSTNETNTAQMVWIDDTGKKYHRKSTCSNMSDPYQVEISTAEGRGYGPCKKCYR
ncbi:MAG: hypothetical protein HDR01_01060 [Lachnospiraceae bacterium]|nr:hypothetical protein [Lachnospiraceae bacterium]